MQDICVSLHERCISCIAEWKNVSCSTVCAYVIEKRKRKQQNQLKRVLKAYTPINIKDVHTWSERLGGIQVGKFSLLTPNICILCIAYSTFVTKN